MGCLQTQNVLSCPEARQPLSPGSICCGAVVVFSSPNREKTDPCPEDGVGARELEQRLLLEEGC